jgi:hypothetical protein
MPITPFLNGAKFEPESKRVMGVAFENGAGGPTSLR